MSQDSPDTPSRFLPVNQNLPVLPLQDILDNNTALSYFIGKLCILKFMLILKSTRLIVIVSNQYMHAFLEFIGWAGGQKILFFWLAIEVSRF